MIWDVEQNELKGLRENKQNRFNKQHSIQQTRNNKFANILTMFNVLKM